MKPAGSGYLAIGAQSRKQQSRKCSLESAVSKAPSGTRSRRRTSPPRAPRELDTAAPPGRRRRP
jgi:hypothetical protein